MALGPPPSTYTKHAWSLGDMAKTSAAMEKVKADKDLEISHGHDGAWVAHPGMVEPIQQQVWGCVRGAMNSASVRLGIGRDVCAGNNLVICAPAIGVGPAISALLRILSFGSVQKSQHPPPNETLRNPREWISRGVGPLQPVCKKKS